MKGYIVTNERDGAAEHLVFGSSKEAEKAGQDIRPCEIMSLWVSPSEALPEKDMKIIFMANGITSMGFYYGEKGRVVGVVPAFLKTEYNIREVSFWMPLPDPPGKNNKA